MLTSGALIQTVAEKEDEKRKLELEKHRKEEDFMMEITRLREQNLKLIQGNKEIQSKYQETLEMAKRVEKLERKAKNSQQKTMPGEVVLKRVDTDGPETGRPKADQGLNKDVSSKDSKVGNLSKKSSARENRKTSGLLRRDGSTSQQNYLLPKRGKLIVNVQKVTLWSEWRDQMTSLMEARRS